MPRKPRAAMPSTLVALRAARRRRHRQRFRSLLVSASPSRSRSHRSLTARSARTHFALPAGGKSESGGCAGRRSSLFRAALPIESSGRTRISSFVRQSPKRFTACDVICSRPGARDIVTAVCCLPTPARAFLAAISGRLLPAPERREREKGQRGCRSRARMLRRSVLRSRPCY